MKKPIQSLPPIIRMIVVIISALFFFVGCGIETPTSSQSNSNHGDLWTPNAGDEMTPGHEVPILQPGYWENLYGPEMNPFKVAPANIFIDDDMGGTVTLGYHSYVISPDAIHGDIMASMAYASYNGVAVDCGPSPFTFDTPIQLTLSYRGTQYENADSPPDLHIFFMPANGRDPIMIPSRVDHINKTVTAPVDHFSRYIIG